VSTCERGTRPFRQAWQLPQGVKGMPTHTSGEVGRPAAEFLTTVGALHLEPRPWAWHCPLWGADCWPPAWPWCPEVAHEPSLALELSHAIPTRAQLPPVCHRAVSTLMGVEVWAL
jgi:hypothetical protein